MISLPTTWHMMYSTASMNYTGHTMYDHYHMCNKLTTNTFICCLFCILACDVELEVELPNFSAVKVKDIFRSLVSFGGSACVAHN